MRVQIQARCIKLPDDDEVLTKMPKELPELTHVEVTAKELLDAYRISTPESLTGRHIREILDRAANLISRFFFVTWHTEHILKAKHAYETKASHKAFPILHFASESVTELFHSLLMAREGFLLQAIHALRRCVETLVYGSFFSLSQLAMTDETEINPFMLMEGTGIWPQSAHRNAIRLSDLRKGLKELSPSGEPREDYALSHILANFTRYYIMKFTIAKCHDHTKDVKDMCIAEIGPEFGLRCADCGKPANSISFNRVPTFNLMLSIVNQRLGRSIGSPDILALYDELSSYIHPNPKGHQHGPSFQMSKVRIWLRLLLSTVKTGTWLYSKTLTAIGFYDEALDRFLQDVHYQLMQRNLNSLRKTYCSSFLQYAEKSVKTRRKASQI